MRQQCTTLCDRKAGCVMFFAYQDLDVRVGNPQAWRLLDTVRYNGRYIQCSIPWLGLNVAYGKV
jgi:hypothetical protein